MEYFKIDDEYELKKGGVPKMWKVYKNGKPYPTEVDKLFKYYSLSINNLDALMNNYFYLSNPRDFNDPFDCNVNLVSNIEDLDNLQITERNSYSNLGIVSFSEEIENHLMWAHYTNNYNGFAIEFKGAGIQVQMDNNKIAKISLVKVLYPKHPTRIKHEYPFAQRYVLTTKFKQWEYEKEWRILTTLYTEDRILPYYPEKVKAIYIGHKIPDQNTSAYRLLISICKLKFPGTPVFIVKPHPTDLKLEFVEVSFLK